MAGQVIPSAFQREYLLGLQRQLLHYFLDNQAASGLILDRQANHAPPRPHGWCSSAASGMGLIALALSAAAPYRLLTPAEAVGRVRTALETALGQLPQDHGLLPHFVDSATGAVWGHDAFSTVDSAWLITGALWAAAFLHDSGLEALAARLYERVDWHYWTAPDLPDARGLLRHGKGGDGRFLLGCWDRLDGEAVFMYVLAAGAAAGVALGPASWAALRPFYGTVAGRRFNNADLGLFAFEYGLDLLDVAAWRPPGEVDLAGDAVAATEANRDFCRMMARAFTTYRRFWGLSDGDGPGDEPGSDAYRAYSPALPLDGTAHLSATTAAVVYDLPAVWENLQEAERDRDLGARGRYGFSNVNLDRGWVSRDVVGIDAGAAVLALDNYLHDGRARAAFHGLGCVRTALERLGFTRTAAPLPWGGAAPTVRDEW
jgi:hypothetical protein